ncbi:MAG: nucleoside 2-deoxyribosyltransferase [Candidatus Bathyarchaeia archaeon]
MKGKAFISGPIQGMETKQSYRETIRRICIRCGYEPIDPWQREKIIYKGTENGWWQKVPAADFIKMDLEDVEKCDILIAYMPKLSAGTCMELFYAKMKGKKTICICKIKNPSPWITTHSDIILKEIRQLEQTLKATPSCDKVPKA